MGTQKQMLYQEADGICCYCGRRTYLAVCSGQPRGLLATIEHIIPRSKGGTSEWNNVALACLGCNTGRGNGPAPPLLHLPKVRKPPPAG